MATPAPTPLIIATSPSMGQRAQQLLSTYRTDIDANNAVIVNSITDAGKHISWHRGNYEIFFYGSAKGNVFSNLKVIRDANKTLPITAFTLSSEGMTEEDARKIDEFAATQRIRLVDVNALKKAQEAAQMVIPVVETPAEQTPDIDATAETLPPAPVESGQVKDELVIAAPLPPAPAPAAAEEKYIALPEPEFDEPEPELAAVAVEVEIPVVAAPVVDEEAVVALPDAQTDFEPETASPPSPVSAQPDEATTPKPSRRVVIIGTNGVTITRCKELIEQHRPDLDISDALVARTDLDAMEKMTRGSEHYEVFAFLAPHGTGLSRLFHLRESRPELRITSFLHPTRDDFKGMAELEARAEGASITLFPNQSLGPGMEAVNARSRSTALSNADITAQGRAARQEARQSRAFQSRGAGTPVDAIVAGGKQAKPTKKPAAKDEGFVKALEEEAAVKNMPDVILIASLDANLVKEVKGAAQGRNYAVRVVNNLKDAQAAFAELKARGRNVSRVFADIDFPATPKLNERPFFGNGILLGKHLYENYKFSDTAIICNRRDKKQYNIDWEVIQEHYATWTYLKDLPPSNPPVFGTVGDQIYNALPQATHPALVNAPAR